MRTIRLILFPISLLFLLGFVLFLISQIANLVYLADRVDPLWGDVVLFALLGLVSGLLAVPLYTYFTLPKAIFPPETDEPEKLQTYRQSLLRRYQKNRLIKQAGLTLETDQDIPKAVDVLDQHADRLIQYNTVRTFAGTAISQNGSFDSMIVLYFAMNTVFRVSRIYWQRTTLRQLINLYSQIGLIVIGAKLLEDNLDQYLEENIDEFIDELMNQGTEATAAVGARATKIIPGVGTVVESIVQGTFNGLMILRLGIITKKFCGATHAVNRKAIRRESYVEARKRIFSVLAKPRKSFYQKLNFFSRIFSSKPASAE